LRWLQDPSQINEDNLNVRREAGRHFRGKWRVYLKNKINELAASNENKNTRDSCRRLNELEEDCQPKNYLANKEKGHLLAE
jgi:hypothetical protein